MYALDKDRARFDAGKRCLELAALHTHSSRTGQGRQSDYRIRTPFRHHHMNSPRPVVRTSFNTSVCNENVISFWAALCRSRGTYIVNWVSSPKSDLAGDPCVTSLAGSGPIARCNVLTVKIPLGPAIKSNNCSWYFLSTLTHHYLPEMATCGALTLLYRHISCPEQNHTAYLSSFVNGRVPSPALNILQQDQKWPSMLLWMMGALIVYWCYT